LCAAPILFGLALDGGRCRVLDLDPVIGAAGHVARADPLADDAFAAELAGVFEDFHSVTVQVLAQVQPRAGITHKFRQPLFADLDRHGPQVFAVEFQQVECEQHRLSFDPAAVPQQVEDRKTLLIANSDLAVDEAGFHLEGAQGSNHRGVAFGPVVAIAGEQPAADATALRHQAEAIHFDFMQPARP
jgi:hypothetical protein